MTLGVMNCKSLGPELYSAKFSHGFKSFPMRAIVLKLVQAVLTSSAGLGTTILTPSINVSLFFPYPLISNVNCVRHHYQQHEREKGMI